MANPEANDTGTDPDLNARFSQLSVSPPTDGTAQGSSNLLHWSDQDASSLYQAASTGFPDTHLLPITDPILAAQNNVQPHPLEHGHYADDMANQAYWQTDGAQTGPSFDPATTGHPLMCPYEDCPKANKVYGRKCDLDKHINNHTKRRSCHFCDGGGAETKDLNRHMWAHHPDEARALNIPKEEDRCPVCGYSGRSDNVKRHRDTKGHW